MPEFILDSAGTVTKPADYCLDDTFRQWEFCDLDAFTQGYIEALFFTETSCIPMVEWDSEESQEAIREGQSDGNIPQDAGFSDLYPESLAKIIADCARFQSINEALLSAARDLEPGSDEFRYAKESLDDRRLGQLFWYARNGHGVGFTDNGNADCLQRLQDEARYNEVNVSFNPDESSPTGYGFVFAE